MMNTLLISIQIDCDVIGLRSLHNYLLMNGYNSNLLFLPYFKPNNKIVLENIKEFILDISPNLIGLSLMSVEFFKAKELTIYLKKNFPYIPVIWGGIHPTLSPEESLKFADYVCIGEGEQALLDFSNAIKENRRLTQINNIAYIEKGEIKKNPLNPLIENLDAISQYQHYLKNSFIHNNTDRILPFDKKLLKKTARYSGTIYSIMTSRGCPFSCTYCCNNFISNLYKTKKIRKRSIENIIGELKQAIRDNPKIEYINFQDDCFLACSSSHLKQFCRFYSEEINKPFIVRCIPTYITREKLKSLKESGLSWIIIGLQSGSDNICENVYKRKSKRENFLKASKLINDFKIAALYDVILDNPFEEERDRLMTLDTLVETPKPYFVQFFSLSLYLGTKLYERAMIEKPDQIEDFHKKDYIVYKKNNINTMMRLAVSLNKRYILILINLYKKDPKCIKFRSALILAKIISLFIIEPISCYQLIRLSQRGSHIRALRVLPNYFKEGIKRYFKQALSASG